MRAIELTGDFGIGNLQLVERPEPTPGPGEVLVEVKACSLNYRDLLMIEGLYDRKLALPLVPLSDGAGVVLEVGEGVTEVAVGDRVAGLFSQAWDAGRPDRRALRTTLGGPLDGMLTERKVLKASGVAKVPAHLSFVEAATLPCAALTAWSAVVELGQVKPGQTVLCLGTGGVSMFALQFAKMAGAKVIVTSSSDEKCARASRLGADHTLNYVDDPRWAEGARELTGGAGVDLVIEVGGSGTFNRSVRATRPGGTIALMGVLAQGDAPPNLVPVLMNQIKVQGVYVGHRLGFEEMCQALMHDPTRVPVVSDTFAWTDVKDALAHLKAGKHFGKIGLSLE